MKPYGLVEAASIASLALVNELAMFARELGIDVHVDMAKRVFQQFCQLGFLQPETGTVRSTMVP